MNEKSKELFQLIHQVVDKAGTAAEKEPTVRIREIIRGTKTVTMRKKNPRSIGLTPEERVAEGRRCLGERD